jgi:hypothetical protein
VSAEPELLEVAEAVVVRPGDTLILRTARPVSHAEVDRIRNYVKERLPDLADVLVATCDQLAVFRPDETKEVT